MASTSKRPRGRPPGSKNKQKKPNLAGEEVDNTIQRIFIDDGNDVVESLLNLAQQHNANITVLSGVGVVSEVTLLDNVSRIPALPIKGTFKMFLLEGTYYNPNCGLVPPQLITNPTCSCFSIKLSSPEGDVFCGTVGGKVKAASQVIVTATLFKKLEFYEMELMNKNMDEAKEVEEGDEPNNVAGDPDVVEPNNVS